MLTLATISLNATVGDIAGNLQKIRHFYEQAATQHADIVIFPELALTGYPPEDLLLLPHFQQAAYDALQSLVPLTIGGPALLLGGVLPQADKKPYNVAFFLEDGKHTHTIFKSHLPNDGVFDEQRVFTSAPPSPTGNIIPFKGHALGVLICEDLWHSDTASLPAQKGAEILISIHASPYDTTKQTLRHHLVSERTRQDGIPVLYINQVGGQDELVFDGGSFSVHQGKTLAQLHWQEGLHLYHWDPDRDTLTGSDASLSSLPLEAHIYHALTLSLTDYIEKNRFPGVILGMSGGVDSALVATIAVDALGKDRVRAVMMPSIYTSDHSKIDAAECTEALGITLETIPIESLVTVYEHLLHKMLASGNTSLASENIQARIRGTLLMAMSNAHNLLVLPTGNKSELAVGYATLYGDMCGGFNVLKDVYKTMVYRLCRWRNELSPVIPERILHKAPTAELRPNQTDQDSLPPYDILDDILQLLIEERYSIQALQQLRPFYNPHTIEQVSSLVIRSEYKRYQSAPGVKITPLAFGRDRRIPITNGFKL